MTLEQAYEEFYEDDKAYEDLCSDKIILFYDHGLYLETKGEYSVLKKYGFIEIFKQFHKTKA